MDSITTKVTFGTLIAGLSAIVICSTVIEATTRAIMRGTLEAFNSGASK